MADTWQHISIPVAAVLKQALAAMERERKGRGKSDQCEPGAAIAAHMAETKDGR